MLYTTIYYTILYYTIYFTTCYNIYYSMLCYTTLQYYTTLYYTTLYYTTLQYCIYYVEFKLYLCVIICVHQNMYGNRIIILCCYFTVWIAQKWVLVISYCCNPVVYSIICFSQKLICEVLLAALHYLGSN